MIITKGKTDRGGWEKNQFLLGVKTFFVPALLSRQGLKIYYCFKNTSSLSLQVFPSVSRFYLLSVPPLYLKRRLEEF
jgi:hypothetical protein